MKSDEDQIRELVSTWHAASRSDDIDAVLNLMTDDVVFLIPGRPPMSKEEFAAVSKVAPGAPRPRIVAKSDIQEIQVVDDWAFMWTRLSVSMTPPGATEALERTGHTLTVLRKMRGKWLIARDANLLSPVQKPPTLN